MKTIHLMILCLFCVINPMDDDLNKINIERKKNLRSSLGISLNDNFDRKSYNLKNLTQKNNKSKINVTKEDNEIINEVSDKNISNIYSNESSIIFAQENQNLYHLNKASIYVGCFSILFEIAVICALFESGTREEAIHKKHVTDNIRIFKAVYLFKRSI